MPSKIFLGNIDYQTHTTNEGDELQRGMQHAGWTLCGFGFGDYQTDVRKILETHNPAAVFVHDKRDWDRENAGCFNPNVHFQNIEALREHPAFKLGVVKDAGSAVKYHQKFIEEDINADAVVTYYNDFSVLPLSPFLRARPRIRTYHSLDLVTISKLVPFEPVERKTALVSGALNNAVYPLRQKIVAARKEIGCDYLAHPGYGNAANCTPFYLSRLRQYKVHLATASKYGFALRKIIESVAMGATPVTDLPEYDKLPEIDGALVRVNPNISIAELRDVVQETAARWHPEERNHWAHRAWDFYNWQAIGLRLSRLIDEAINPPAAE